MNRNFKKYAQIWLLVLAVFVTVVFLFRPVIPGMTIEYDTRFWIAFSTIAAAFVINLACACVTFHAKNLNSLFYNIPLIAVTYSTLIVMTILGLALMLIPNCPVRFTVIVCVIALAFNLAVVVETTWVSGAVRDVDKNIKSQTGFIANLTLQAESVLTDAQSGGVRTVCKKVCDAARYSDPMSRQELSEIESKITFKMGEFAAAVGTDDEKRAGEAAEEIAALIGLRNKKCKMLK